MKICKFPKEYTSHITVDPNMPHYDYSKDPYFIKKNAEMKEFLEKYPTPSMIESRKEKNKK